MRTVGVGCLLSLANQRQVAFGCRSIYLWSGAYTFLCIDHCLAAASEGNSHIGKFLSCEQRLFSRQLGKKIFNHTLVLGSCLRTRSFCPDAVRGNEQSTGPDSTFSGGQLLILRFVQSISAARRFSRLQVPCSASKAKGKGQALDRFISDPSSLYHCGNRCARP